MPWLSFFRRPGIVRCLFIGALSGFFVPLGAALHGDITPTERTLDEILEAYLETMGGPSNLEELSSVRFAAELELKNGDSLDLLVFKKRPVLYRLVVQQGATQLIRAYDGNVAWEIPPGGLQKEARPMTGAAAKSFIRDAPLESPFLHGEEKGLRFDLRGITRLLGRECYVIRIYYPDEKFIDHFIDAEDYVERLIVNYVEHEGREEKLQLLPSDYRKVDGVLFSFRVVNMRDGEQESTVRIHTIDTNIGLMDTIFAFPGETE